MSRERDTPELGLDQSRSTVGRTAMPTRTTRSGIPTFLKAQRPHALGRRLFGRVAIANADSGAAAFTNVAIDQAERAVRDCPSSPGMGYVA